MTRPLPAQAFFLPREIIKAISEEEVEATYRDMCEMDLARPPYRDFDLILPADCVFKVGPDSLGTIKAWVCDHPNERWRDAIPDTMSGLGETTRDYVRQIARSPDEANAEIAQAKMVFGFRQIVDPANMLIQIEYIKASERPCSLAMDMDLAKFNKACEEFACRLYRALVVLLATRNAEKVVTKDKLACAGIGRDKRYKYTTTIRLGGMPHNVDGTPGGHVEHTAADSIPRRPHLRRGHIRRQHHGPRNQFTKSIWIEPCFVNADENFISARTGYNVRTS